MKTRGPSEFFARCVKYNMLIYGSIGCCVRCVNLNHNMHLNACRQQKGHNLWSKVESTKKLRGHSAGRSRVGANTEEIGHKQHKQNGHPSEQKDNKRVGKDTSRAQRYKEWAQRNRVGRKSQRVQKDRVGTNTASSHKHKECAQAEWAETPTRDRERSK